MKVSLAKHGGFAAGLRLGRPPALVDSSELPPKLRSELEALVAAAREDQPSGSEAPGLVRDGVSYMITVEDGPEPLVLRGSDGETSPAFDALSRWIELHAKPGSQI